MGNIFAEVKQFIFGSKKIDQLRKALLKMQLQSSVY